MAETALLQALRGVIDAEPAIRVAYLYGSCARGDFGPTSDVDVALLAARPIDLMDLAAIGAQLGTLVDRRADVVDLRSAPPLLCRQVVAEGELLLVRDPLLRFDFEQEAVRRCEDTRPLRAQQQQLLRERLAHGG
ncbi:MAG TPA: nucleotidyltransferase domain-containing protein [Polyangia bacterium]